MNVDWHRETTLGPQSLLKTLAACQGSSNFAVQREPCWQLVRSQGVTWRPGGNNIFQNAQANSPMMGDSKDCRYALPCPRCGTLIHLCKELERTLRWPSSQSWGHDPLSTAEGALLKPGLASTYCHILNSFTKRTLYMLPRGVPAPSAFSYLLFSKIPQWCGHKYMLKIHTSVGGRPGDALVSP